MSIPKRRRFVIPLIVSVLVLGALSRSSGLASIRAVDAILLFAAGLSVGVALGSFVASRET